ncbi:MAG: hypothetical protein EAZ97_13440 [Bacteroidetes bacterium]|nr:MAG: hypothetical protein EAZ97_13440 [Bacteroidota bacterium]
MCLFISNVSAQGFFDKLKKKAEAELNKAVNKTVDKATEKATEKIMDKTRDLTASMIAQKVDANKQITPEYAGGISGGDYAIDLGTNKAKVTLYYCNYTISDRIWISYQGKNILEIGCVATGGDEKNPVWKATDFEIDGKKTVVYVHITGNCSNRSDGNQTKWLFRVERVESENQEKPIKVETEDKRTLDECLCKEKGEYAVSAKNPIMGGDYGKTGSGADQLNIQQVHEHIFICKDGKIVDNIGFRGAVKGEPFGKGQIFSYNATEIQNGVTDDRDLHKFAVSGKYTDVEKLRSAINFIKNRKEYKTYEVVAGDNCQVFVDDVKKAYEKPKLSKGTQVNLEDAWYCQSGQVICEDGKSIGIPAKICRCK